mmetsp:Transcript_831/g.2372  ORF Transcript_831/g.2372 Transcript_831/m.2372 type:complete len:87 (+) Transcript_831:35-295(+)
MPVIKVLLFGPGREAMDTGALSITLPDDSTHSVAEIRKIMLEDYLPLGELMKVSKFSVDQVYVSDEAGTMVSETTEVALINPISGG